MPQAKPQTIKDMQNDSKETLLNKNNRLYEYYCIKDNPEALTNELVRAIGKFYLEDYSNWSGNLFHSNHALAKRLICCNENDSYSRWLLLKDVYEQLQNTSGNLGATLVFLTVHAFNARVMFLAGTGPFAPIYTPSGVAYQLQSAITGFYAALSQQHQF